MSMIDSKKLLRKLQELRKDYESSGADEEAIGGVEDAIDTVKEMVKEHDTSDRESLKTYCVSFAVKRYYKTYVDVKRDLTDVEVAEVARQHVMQHPEALIDDEDLEIDPDDIMYALGMYVVPDADD